MSKREELISDIALSLATGSSEDEICERYNITPSRLNSIKKRSDLEYYVRAYRHNLQSGMPVEKLNFIQMRATIVLSFIAPNKCPRTEVLEILDPLLHGSEDPNEFLLEYEQRHGACWDDLPQEKDKGD